MQEMTTIIFDLGGVVLNNDWHDGNERKFRQYEVLFDITYDDMERGWNEAWPSYRLGKISEDEFWNIFLTQAGSNKINVDKAKEFWRKYVFENESMFALLKKLKSKYKLGALTTIGKEWLNYKTNKFNLKDYFSVIVSSCLMGMEKTDVKMHQKVLDSLSVSAHECVFIDDTPEELIPAKQLGINTILFKSQSELEVELKKLGLFI